MSSIPTGLLKNVHLIVTGVPTEGDVVKVPLSTIETVQATLAAGTAYISAEITGSGKTLTIHTNNLLAGTAYITASGRV